MLPVQINRNLLILHLTVIVWGFTGILGNLISISAINLVWYRVLIASVSLLLFFLYKRKSLVVPRERLVRFFLTGGLVGLHWILFFESIKVSTVSVTLVCLSAVTLFTAMFEPIIYKRKVSKVEVVTGFIVIIGICLIFKFEGQYVKGIVLGLLAALFACFFAIINSKLVKKSEPSIISFYEMFGALLWISLYLLATNGFGEGMRLSTSDFIYLMILGTVCTSGAYVAAVAVMKEISAFRVALASNLEPIYGVLLAFAFFGQAEVMSVGFYVGALLILGAVFLHPIIRIQVDKRRALKASLPPLPDQPIGS